MLKFRFIKTFITGSLFTFSLIIPSNGMSDTAYVSNLNDYVSVINTATNAVTATITVTGEANDVAITPDGTSAYVTNNSQSYIWMIETATQAITGTIAVGNASTGVAITPDGRYIYVANQNSGSVSVIDTTTMPVTVTATVMMATPYGVAIVPILPAANPPQYYAYVTNDATLGTVSVIDPTTTPPFLVTLAITVGSHPHGIAVSSDGAHAYVANQGDGTVSVIDTTQTPPVTTDTVIVGSSPTGVAAGPDVYVTNTGNGSVPGSVSVLQPTTNTIIATVAVGFSPAAVALTIDSSHAYVANTDDGTLSVIQTTPFPPVVVTTFSVQGTPTGIAIVAGSPPTPPSPPSPPPPPSQPPPVAFQKFPPRSARNPG